MSGPVREAEVDGRSGRLDAVAAAVLGIPRADVQRAIAEGRIRVDGLVRAKSFRLRGTERLTLDLAGLAEVPAEGPAVPIRYEDEHLAIVAKPAGLATHPTAGRRSGTLVNRLLGMGMPLSSVGGPLRPGIVHRLDAGTSGLLLVAKDDATHEVLADRLRRHEVRRRYLALARGRVQHERFEVDAPLGRRGARIVVHTGSGRPSSTVFEVRERLAAATLLEAAPRTGRTHQIRVHLSAAGHPIIGDGRYGGGGDDARRLELRRPFLHAWRLELTHPASGELLEAEEPLPPDLTRALELARSAG